MDCLKKSQTASWDAMLRYVSKAVVFLDNVSAECLHWSIGVDAVFNAGAIAIKDFTAFECGEDSDTKAVFVLNNLLCDNVQDTICDIVKASQFHKCIIIYSSKPAATLVNEQSTAAEKTMFDQIQQRIQYYMKDKQAICDVHFIPLMDFSVGSNLFIVPAFSHLFPMLTTDLIKIKGLSSKIFEDDSHDVVNDIHFEMLPSEIQLEYKLLIGSLNDVCERLDVNEDIYCIGPTSQLIATQLAALSSAKVRRKSASKRAALVVVDRTLDLAGPVSHACETLADKIFASLPRLQGHNTDVAIDMSMLCSNESVGKPSVLSPGSLAQPQDNNCLAILNTLIMSKTKESLMEVNRQIVDVIVKEKLNDPQVSMKMGRGAELLKYHLNLFSVEKTSESFERNCGLLQLSVGCLQAMQLDQQYEKYQLLEKIIIQSSANLATNSPCSHLLDAYSKRAVENGHDNAENVLQSLVYLYSMHGNSVISRDDEDQLKQLLTDYVLHNPDTLHPYFDSRRGVDDIFNELKAIGMARDHLKQFKKIIEDGNDMFPSTYKPFLQQLAEKIVDPSRPDLSDLLHRSTGLRDRIKTSFRLFMNVSKPRPSDHPLLIIYIIGGVTCSEVRAINEVSTRASQEILLGSTRLLKPNDVIDMVFQQKF